MGGHLIHNRKVGSSSLPSATNKISDLGQQTTAKTSSPTLTTLTTNRA
jgi:hypothetical protein